MSRVVLTSSRQLSLGGAAATVMGPSRARAPSGVSQTDWDDNTALQMIFDRFETTAELQQELQDLKGVKLLQRFIHGLLSNERGRLCDVLDEVAQEAGLYQQGEDGRTPKQRQRSCQLHHEISCCCRSRATRSQNPSGDGFCVPAALTAKIL
jgi:hypothetical protein